MPSRLVFLHEYRFELDYYLKKCISPIRKFKIIIDKWSIEDYAKRFLRLMGDTTLQQYHDYAQPVVVKTGAHYTHLL